jgi:KRAB domain-containing zinc finger protein
VKAAKKLRKEPLATADAVTEMAPKIAASNNLENVPLRDRLRNRAGRRESTHSCKECGKQFDKKPELQQHMNDSHEKNDCGELIDSREEAEKHESTPQNIPCPECKDVFPTQDSLKTHIEMVHTLKKPFSCAECGRHFVSKGTVRVHIRTHTDKRTTVCGICKKAFRTVDALKQHKFVHMTDEEKNKKGFPCTICDKKFSRRTKLEYHMRRHNDERHFICTICNKSFHDSVRLKAHIERHSTDKKFKCDDCDAGFVCKRYLTNHKSRYHRRREVIRCSVCSVTFPTTGEATKHFKTHTKEEIRKCGTANPYTQSFDLECRLCREYFPGKEKLDAHKAVAHVRGRHKTITALTIADLIKEVDCTVCGKKLWGLGSLKRHMSLHNGTRPERTFQCEFCAKMFAQKAQLTVHIRTHTGERPHRCSYCGKGFITGQSLIKHERIHTGETPYPCPQCPKAFRSKENLILHQKVSQSILLKV